MAKTSGGLRGRGRINSDNLWDNVAELSKSVRGMRSSIASTETIYVTYDGKKVRISDHEPNFGAERLRGRPDLEIYTHDIVGKQIKGVDDVVVELAEYFNVDIPPELKKNLDRITGRRIQEQNLRRTLREETRRTQAILADKRKVHYNRILQAIHNKSSIIDRIHKGAEEYGAQGSSRKRNKRENSYFKREFEKAFGFQATRGEVSEAKKLLKKDRL